MEREENRPRRRAWIGTLVAAAALGLALFAPASSLAATTHLIPNWPELLPPWPGTPSGTVPLDFDVCPGGDASCPGEVIDEMYERWEPLDASCDHEAVFGLTYLRTTEEFQRTIDNDPAFFSDPAWVNHEDAIFAELYFQAYDNWHSGNRDAVPGAWKVAFEANRSPDLMATGDLLLGLNAHINRDLPYTLAAVGLVKPDGSSRKPDHDHVNAFLEQVADPLQVELAQRYDSIFELTDLEPSPVDEEAVLQAVRLFRENAWRNAERLVAARNADELQAASDLIEFESELFANLIVLGNTVPGYGASRDATCAAQPPEDARAAGQSSVPNGAAAPTAAAAPVSSAKAKRCKKKKRGRAKPRRCRRR